MIAESQVQTSTLEARIFSQESYITTLTTDILTQKNIPAIRQLPDTIIEFDSRISNLEGSGLEDPPEEVPD